MHAEFQRMAITEPQPQASTSGPPTAQQARARPLSEYQLEPELAKALKQAASSQGSIHGRRKPGIHLAVLGHVDAGKSTLMGRLLHEMG